MSIRKGLNKQPKVIFGPSRRSGRAATSQVEEVLDAMKRVSAWLLHGYG
jgi:hypothetical protein